MMDTTREIRLKRLKIRCWRRGTKEMDLILGGFADRGMVDLSEAELTTLEALLEENDHDLYQWITAQRQGPAEYGDLIERLRAGLGEL
jgi:antitoxin CptB